jgi:sulfide:quinone oxidoreductase
MNTTTSTSTGRRVVIAGAGFAGLGAAHTLRQLLSPNDRVTVVASTGHFVFSPSLVWTPFGRSSFSASFDLESSLAAHGIAFLQAPVREVRLEDRVVVSERQELPYDRLLIATGGRPDSSAIPGLAGEFRHASWVVGEDSAMEARNAIRGLFEKPGPVVIGVAPGAPFISAAYELALTLAAALSKRGLRDRAPITFVTAEPSLGDLGLGQHAAGERLDQMFSHRAIASFTDVRVERVGGDEVKLSNGHTLPSALTIIMPPFTGAVAIWKSAGLTDEDGLIPVNPSYQHAVHPEVYAAGVASYFGTDVPPLGPVHLPATGYLSLNMGIAAGRNIAASLGSGAAPANPLPTLLDIRVLDGADTGMLLYSRGRTHLYHHAIPLPGTAAHLLKLSLERYLLWRLRTGRMELP